MTRTIEQGLGETVRACATHFRVSLPVAIGLGTSTHDQTETSSHHDQSHSLSKIDNSNACDHSESAQDNFGSLDLDEAVLEVWTQWRSEVIAFKCFPSPSASESL
jgi:hypothetical protein